jgi:hypothetical protein
MRHVEGSARSDERRRGLYVLASPKELQTRLQERSSIRLRSPTAQGMQSCRQSQKNAAHKRERAKNAPTEQMIPC